MLTSPPTRPLPLLVLLHRGACFGPRRELVASLPPVVAVVGRVASLPPILTAVGGDAITGGGGVGGGGQQSGKGHRAGTEGVSGESAEAQSAAQSEGEEEKGGEGVGAGWGSKDNTSTFIELSIDLVAFELTGLAVVAWIEPRVDPQ